MILTIWRHGAAEEGVNDRLRELSGAGRDDVGFGSHRFHDACKVRNIPHPHKILHSPLVRTTQTAEIVAAAFTHASITAVSALQPGSSVAAVDAAVAGFIENDSPKQHTLLVSHQPLVAHLVEHYLGGGGIVPFLPPGGLVTLSLEHLAAGSGRLLFWAQPPDYEADM
jgi:phosphohistidine phosphatase SixA